MCVGRVQGSPYVTGEVGDFGVVLELRCVAEVNAVAFGVFQVLLVLVLTSTGKSTMTPKQTEKQKQKCCYSWQPCSDMRD